MAFLRIGEVIEDKHAVDLIACLYMRGEMTRTCLCRSISTNPRMGQKVDRLIDLGLIESRRRGRVSELSLSEKGEDLARGLCMIEERMFGDLGDAGHLYYGWMDPVEDTESVRDEYVAPDRPGQVSRRTCCQ